MSEVVVPPRQSSPPNRVHVSGPVIDVRDLLAFLGLALLSLAAATLAFAAFGGVAAIGAGAGTLGAGFFYLGVFHGRRRPVRPPATVER